MRLSRVDWWGIDEGLVGGNRKSCDKKNDIRWRWLESGGRVEGEGIDGDLGRWYREKRGCVRVPGRGRSFFLWILVSENSPIVLKKLRKKVL